MLPLILDSLEIIVNQQELALLLILIQLNT